jgi:dynein heavy chain
VRLIWAHSSFYNTRERITGLLRKVSNAVINRCVAVINLDDLFAGQVERSTDVLQASIDAGTAWIQLYQRTAERLAARPAGQRAWDVDDKNVFLQLQAFVTRCHDLVEVCEGQVQFARRSLGKQTKLPRFGGARGSEIAKNLLDIQAAFERQLGLLRSVNYFILDVKASMWHEDFNQFKKAVKELEASMTNVMSTAFDSVSTVAHGVEVFTPLFLFFLPYTPIDSSLTVL